MMSYSISALGYLSQKSAIPSTVLCILRCCKVPTYSIFMGSYVRGAVLMASAWATIQNKQDVSLFGRNISRQAINKAVAVTMMSFAIMFTSTILLSAVSDADALDVLFETVSATATVGLTRDLTPYLNEAGKMIITGTMYLGRVGPISLALALNSGKKHQNIIKNPTEEISVG